MCYFILNLQQLYLIFFQESSVDDLISLGSVAAPDDDIFDPLLLRSHPDVVVVDGAPAARPHQSLLPRPPSAKVAAITQMYEQNQHKPLQRPESTNPFR